VGGWLRGRRPAARWPYEARIDSAAAWGTTAAGIAVGGIMLTVLATVNGSHPHFRLWWPTDWMFLPAGLTFLGLVMAIVPLRHVKHPEVASAGSVESEETASDTAAGLASARPAVPVITWEHGTGQAEYFVGRTKELARLDRWASDFHVNTIGVTAWGGAGKTALVVHWVQQADWSTRPEVRGVFGWSFNVDPSVENWSAGLLAWAERRLGIGAKASSPAASILALLQTVPLILVLDGLEIVQQGFAEAAVTQADLRSGRYGRLLDGLLRDVLAGACQTDHQSLIVLTSRFPLADLEMFDGGAARMLEVPAFTADEGSRLLSAAGGYWLADSERQQLVVAVQGHALAVSVLAAVLAARPAVGELAALRNELADAMRSDIRIGRVLGFYSTRLTEQDRYLVAAVSLFARPVSPEALLAVSKHEAFKGLLEQWTVSEVDTAVTARLVGVVSRHPDGTLSCHPLVRDAFLPLVLKAAPIAVDVMLVGLPRGRVTSPAAARLVVEAIELLLDADQWNAADDLYRSRAGDGAVWTNLAIARLGLRAASAFAMPLRRDACTARLGSARLGYYINETGERALFSGSLHEARDHLSEAVAHSRKTGDATVLWRSQANLIACLGYLGEINAARDIAARVLQQAEAAENRLQVLLVHAEMGWLAGLAGDSIGCDEHFAAADYISILESGVHLHSLPGTQWAEALVRTNRLGPASALTDTNRRISYKSRRKAHVARCDQLSGHIALTRGDTLKAREKLAAATQSFRDGDYLLDLPGALTDLAEYARVTGNLDAAVRHADEAIAIARPRDLVAALSAALTVRARICADQFKTRTDRHHLDSGRDAVDAAIRLATSRCLPWRELDALRVHAILDEAEGTEHQYATRSAALQSRLIPPGLDPDPLATVDRKAGHDRPGRDAG
jgi:tetratricopeptide (TPR) repeat protein